MTTLILAFGVIGTVILIMAIGVIFSNKPIKGSCGGMSALGMEVACEICGGDQAKCDEENERIQNKEESVEDLSYNASK